MPRFACDLFATLFREGIFPAAFEESDSESKEDCRPGAVPAHDAEALERVDAEARRYYRVPASSDIFAAAFAHANVVCPARRQRAAPPSTESDLEDLSDLVAAPTVDETLESVAAYARAYSALFTGPVRCPKAFCETLQRMSHVVDESAPVAALIALRLHKRLMQLLEAVLLHRACSLPGDAPEGPRPLLRVPFPVGAVAHVALAASMIGAKICSDSRHNCRFFARLGGLRPSVVPKIEAAALSTLHFEGLFVSVRDLEVLLPECPSPLDAADFAGAATPTGPLIMTPALRPAAHPAAISADDMDASVNTSTYSMLMERLCGADGAAEGFESAPCSDAASPSSRCEDDAAYQARSADSVMTGGATDTDMDAAEERPVPSPAHLLMHNHRSKKESVYHGHRFSSE